MVQYSPKTLPGDPQHRPFLRIWEDGLPSSDDLPPLSQLLIPPEVASAFDITPDSFQEPDDDDDRSRKIRRVESAEEAESAMRCDDQLGRATKRPRLVWTPQLHKRFVDVVSHLGIKNAVPKTIMQLMNVEGLTRENVASHLQKYRLYLKRIQGLSSEGPSSSDQLFASTPVPQSFRDGGNGERGGPVPMGHSQGPMNFPYLRFLG